MILVIVADNKIIDLNKRCYYKSLNDNKPKDVHHTKVYRLYVYIHLYMYIYIYIDALYNQTNLVVTCHDYFSH